MRIQLGDELPIVTLVMSTAVHGVDYKLWATPPRESLPLAVEGQPQPTTQVKSTDVSDDYASMLQDVAMANDLEATHLAELSSLQRDMLREREVFAGLITQVRREQTQWQTSQKAREDDLVSSLQSREAEAQARESQLLVEASHPPTAQPWPLNHILA